MASLTPDVLGKSCTPVLMIYFAMSSVAVLSKFIRFMAIVTISVLEAIIDFSITSPELNFPVPKNNRDLNSLFPIFNIALFFCKGNIFISIYIR